MIQHNPPACLPLETGDHLDQKTFHECYEAMPPHIKAELVGGVVFLGGRVKPRHGRMHARLVAWLGRYEEETTVILGPRSEPQPDAFLITSPASGGPTSVNADEYLTGAPELMSEIATGPESIDLHGKRHDYEQAGVKEYLVITLRHPRVSWFIARSGRFEELAPAVDGLLRSETFPGLWLDPAAWLRGDTVRVSEILRQGLASAEHAAFVARLAQQGASKVDPDFITDAREHPWS
jgi:Uma2 family endonuclease